MATQRNRKLAGTKRSEPTPDLIREICAKIREDSSPIEAAAGEFGIDPKTLVKWGVEHRDAVCAIVSAANDRDDELTRISDGKIGQRRGPAKVARDWVQQRDRRVRAAWAAQGIR